MNNTYYYIYNLIDPRNGQPFYVGKGKHVPGRTARWRGHISEARKWTPTCHWGNHLKLNIIREILNEGLEPSCEVVYSSDDEHLVFLVEQQEISRHGRLCNGTGILTNLTKGGEGTSAKKQWQLERQSARRRKMLGKNNPMYGKAHTTATKRQISNTRKQRILDGTIVPTKHSPEWKETLRTNNPGGKATARPIYQIDMDGNVICVWNSARSAAISLGLTLGNICACAKQYKHRRFGGYFWRWADDNDVVNNVLTNIDALVSHLQQPHNKHGRKGKPKQAHLSFS